MPTLVTTALRPHTTRVSWLRFLGVLGVILTVGGCADVTAEPTTFDLSFRNLAPEEGISSEAGTYVPGFSAFVVVLLPEGATAIEAGDAASPALERLAEEGDPAAFARELRAQVGNGSVASYMDRADYQTGPLLPGRLIESSFTADPGERLFLAAMYGPSNDVFVATAPAGAPLWENSMPTSGSVAMTYWDAGTEMNEPPGFGEHQPSQSMETGPIEAGVISSLDGRKDSAGHEYADLTVILSVELTPRP